MLKFRVAMLISNSGAETVAIGAQCAKLAKIGDVFALTGEVGAGKTQFVKGFVAGSGSERDATSPTFTLVHEYDGGVFPIYHFDFYRVDSPDAVMQLGFNDYLYGDGVCLIEWADRFPELIPPDAFKISIEAKTETERLI